mgnify:CR=1 FL=1|jgi:hypothetical protein|tara:strand:- start:15 stop:137 length:123 start_codon:yes stop_codon:yes gene_type:complete
MYHHKFSLRELDEMIPWEREIYLSMLVNKLKQERDARKQT